MKNKLICALAAAALLLAGCGAAGRGEGGPPPSLPEATPGGEALNDKTNSEFLPVAREGDLALEVRPETGEFRVTTGKGTVWYSNPEDRSSDTFAGGVYQSELAATFVLNYFDPDTGEDSRMNTMSDSAYDGNFTIDTVPGGFCATYSFERMRDQQMYSIDVPLYVYLEDGTLKALVAVDQIKNPHPSLFLYGVSLLPYFGAGGERDEGYAFVPDGSGALIDFNQGKDFVQSYSRQIYGREPSKVLSNYDLTVDSRDIRLPVFGMRRGDAAFFAVAEEGVEQGTIVANGNMQITSYTNVNADFAIRDRMDYEIGRIKNPVLEKGEASVPRIGVRYRFLEDGEADYSGMARGYRRVLIDAYGLTEQAAAPALFVELYGGVEKTVSRMGIQGETVEALTTAGQVETIADELEKRGVGDVVFLYRSWNKQGLAGKPVTSAKADGALSKGGSIRGLTESDRFLFYPAFDSLLSFSDIGFIAQMRDTACDLSGVALRPRQFSAGMGNADGESYFYLTVDKIAANAAKLNSAVKKDKIKNLALSDLARLLYNDYRDGNVKRADTRREILRAMGELDGSAERMLLEYPGDYALPYADDLFALPTGSSGHDLISRDVPFYQIAVGGLVRYACQPLNNGNAGGDAFLKAVETGSCLSYTWFYEDASRLRDTELATLSGCQYELTIDEAARQAGQLAEIAAVTGGGRLTGHSEAAPGVSVSRYENGTLVYVNYTGAAWTAGDGTRVDARSFAAVKGGSGA